MRDPTLRQRLIQERIVESGAGSNSFSQMIERQIDRTRRQIGFGSVGEFRVSGGGGESQIRDQIDARNNGEPVFR